MAPTALQFDVEAFTQAISLLIRRHRAATAAHELSLTESAAIARLAKDGPATTAELARAVSVKPQSMGATIAALEQRGIVERKPHPTDGRQLTLELTAKGAALRNQIRAAKRTWLAEAVAQLPPQDQSALAEAGEIIMRLVEL